MLFGFIKGVLLCAGILVVLVAFLPDRAPLLTGSRVAPHIIGISWELGRLVPGKLGERFREPSPSWHDVDKWSESEAEKTEPGNE